LLFPEIIGCFIIFLASPFWEIQLLGRGRTFAAVVLPIGVVIGSYLLYTGTRRSNWWAAYAGLIAAFVTAVVVYKLGGAPIAHLSSVESL
jgi:hypothetical protein